MKAQFHIFNQLSRKLILLKPLYDLAFLVAKKIQPQHYSMGNGNYNSVDDSNRTLHRNLSSMGVKSVNSYRFVQKKDDQSIIVQNIDTHTYYLLRTLTVTAQQDAESFARILQKRNKITCIHLCKIIAIKKQQETLACSEIYKLHVLVECPLKSMKIMLEQKMSANRTSKEKQYFHESQLWGIAYSVVKALKSLYLYGIVHQSLSLQSIYINEKGLIKLADPALFGLEKNYITAMKEKQNCEKIISPQIIVFLDEFNFYFYEKEKSDIFVLGILLIQLCNLKEFPVYDYKEKTPRFQLIQINLGQIRNRYSQSLCNTLEWMTQIEPKKRPRLSQLMDFIDKNNNSDRSTSVTNTVAEPPTEIHTLSAQKVLGRNKTVSAFTIDPQPANPQIYQSQPQILRSSQPLQKEPSNKRTPTEESRDIFPFELIYNRVINNNDNMKRFEINHLYEQYKYNDIFNSSARGSVPSSSYHAKLQHSSRDIANKNIKMYNAMGYSRNSFSKGDYLVYSQSSAFNQSNKQSFSKNELADIKLVESSHFRQAQEGKKVHKHEDFKISNIIEDANEQMSIESPYRKLTSHKNSQGKSLTSIKYMDIQTIINKQNQQMKHSDILPKYSEQNKGNNLLHDYVNQLENRYFSQQQEKDIKTNVLQNEFQSYQSQNFKGEEAMGRHLNERKEKEAEIVMQQKYDKYLLSDKIISKENQKYLSSKQRVDSSKNMSFQSSQIQSKISRVTPNFAQKSQVESRSQKEDFFLKDFNFLQENEVEFVENDINEEGSIYTGYKSKNGLKERHGKLQFHDGGYYEGQWKNDKMQGYGELYYASGALAYKGLWLEGCFNGNGHIFNDKPEYFDQQFDYRNFTDIQDKWLNYEGQFQSDSKHGQGRINLTNGEYFEGTFDYDMIEGHGTFHKKTGQIIKGLWKDNELVEYE